MIYSANQQSSSYIERRIRLARNMRSILGLIYSINTLQSMGVDTQSVLREHGLNQNNIDPSAFIDSDQEINLLTDLIAPLNDPQIGLKVGHQFGLAGYGPFSMLLMTSANAYEACRTGIRYQEVTYLNSKIELQLGTHNSALNFISPDREKLIWKFLVDKDISGTYKLAEDIAQIIGQEMKLLEAGFPYPKPKDSRVYDEIFHCKIHFDQPQAKLVFDSFDLMKPFPQANKAAFELYKSQCDQLLNLDTTKRQDLAASVRKHLELFVYDFPTIGEVAHTFNTSERTLRRKLAHQGISFQKLIDKVRFDKAKTLLIETVLPIETIAQKLGYRETASFNHAFNRWQGQSPSFYRKNNETSF